MRYLIFLAFILGTMKFEAKIVPIFPVGMETVLKPRVFLAMKIKDMNSTLKTPSLLKALRLAEERFLNLFVKYYDREIADESMKFYKRD